MKRLAALAAACLALAGCSSPNTEMHWRQEMTDDGNMAVVTLSGLPQEDGSGWYVMMSQIADRISQEDTSLIVIEHVNGNLFRIRPSATYRHSPEITFSYRAAHVGRHDLAPQGAFYVDAAGESRGIPLLRTIEAENDGEQVYAENIATLPSEAGRFDIVPAVKELKLLEGSIDLSNGVAVSVIEVRRPNMHKAADRLVSELRRIGIDAVKYQEDNSFGHAERDRNRIEITISVPVLLSFETMDFPENGYLIDCWGNDITIFAQNPEDALNGVATLVAFIENGSRDSIRHFSVRDWPDLDYRGLMLDVARNFIGKDDVLILLDILARLKVNRFHFHLADDEGWRLEIERFPELTSLGAHHGWSEDFLMPSYDGNCDPQAALSSNGFYTRTDFVEILRKARSLGITVIPEIESPGHARAAIKAMEAYSRRTGTEEFLLSDPLDRSAYLSAQMYRDNVMNVAMESTYSFMAAVMDELASMYDEAGVPFREIHIGGDEVARGSWTGSPECSGFMQEHGMDSVRELKTYFVMRMADICSQRGLKVSGWQEMPMNIDPSCDARLQKVFGTANCWNTVAEWGDDHTSYTLANRGYPVVLSNVTNTYADLAYRRHVDERGHTWGGTVDAHKSYALNPWNIYLSQRTALDGTPADLAKACTGKPKLKRPERIAGVQAQLFTETVRSFDDVCTYLFPKIIGVFERGWNSAPEWSCDTDDTRFEQGYAKFNAILCANVLPSIASTGAKVHVPQPGIHFDGSGFVMNCTAPDAQIRYTLDGSEPTEESPLYEGRIAMEEPARTRRGQPATPSVIRARAFWLGCSSVTTCLKYPSEHEN